MDKYKFKEIIVLTLVCALIFTPTLSSARVGDGGARGPGHYDPMQILIATVFIVWTAVLISALLAHADLNAKRFVLSVLTPLSIIPPLIALSMLAKRPLIASTVLTTLFSMAIIVTLMTRFSYGTVALSPSIGLFGLAPFTMTSLSKSPSALLMASILTVNFSLILARAMGRPPVFHPFLIAGQERGLVNLVITPTFPISR